VVVSAHRSDATADVVAHVDTLHAQDVLADPGGLGGQPGAGRGALTAALTRQGGQIDSHRQITVIHVSWWISGFRVEPYRGTDDSAGWFRTGRCVVALRMTALVVSPLDDGAARS
jgi:hypothetical protein